MIEDAPESKQKSSATIRKHSITLHGHATSFSLEDAFHDLLIAIARRNKQSLASLIASIDAKRGDQNNLSSSLRLYVLEWVMLNNQIDLQKQSLSN